MFVTAGCSLDVALGTIDLLFFEEGCMLEHAVRNAVKYIAAKTKPLCI